MKDRPEIINERGRNGDFEGNTVISGRKYKGGAVTLANRKSRYYLIRKIANLEAKIINFTINSLLKGKNVKSITFDNGVKFSEISKLPRPCFRVDPYSSYQRNTNEKHNGFLRGFISKGVNINDWTD